MFTLQAACIAMLFSFAVACNPLSENQTASTKSADFNPGLSVQPTATPGPTTKSLDSSWTPHYSDLLLYLQYPGVASSSIADGASLAGVTGISGLMNGAGANYSAAASAPTNGAIDFTGGQGVEITGTGSALPFIAKNFTVMTWIKTSSTNNWERVIGNGGLDYLSGFFIQMSPQFYCGHFYTGSFIFGLGSSAQAIEAATVYRTLNAYNDGLWHHIALVVEQVSAKKVSFYVDGVLAPIETAIAYEPGSGCAARVSCGTVTGNVGDFSACTQASSLNSFPTTWMATHSNHWSDKFNGSLSETAAFEAAFSSAEINRVYQQQR